MATPIIMPRQGQSVESCIIAKWHKKKGDSVAVGEILFSYETDKASFDEEAKAAGTLLDIFFEEGDDVPCLVNVCVIGNPGESTAEFNPKGAGAAPATPAAASAGMGTAGAQAATDASAGAVPASAAVASAANATATIPAAPAVTAIDVAAGNAASSQQAPVQAGIVPGTDATQMGGDTIIGAGVSPFQPVPGDQLKISPRAKNLAERTGVDYRYANATGPYGRIIEKDVIALKESGPVFTAPARAERMRGEAGAAAAGTGLGGRITTADLAGASATGRAQGAAAPAGAGTAAGAAASGAAEYDEVKLPNIRKVIAKAMHQSLSTMAQLTLNSSFDATDVMEFRKKLKESRERLGLENITINDIIIYAVSRTLANHKSLNAHYLEDRMLYFKNVNIGVAVDTERGLMVPVVSNANLKSLNEISAEVKKLVKDCQAGTINPDLLKNGTFTITNLGTLDVESFTPVINPPQTGILGVNNIVQRAREVDGEIGFYPAMGLSLTFDHRALDGAPAARFLKDLKTNLESFTTMLVR